MLAASCAGRDRHPSIGTTSDEAKLFTAFSCRQLAESDEAGLARRIERHPRARLPADLNGGVSADALGDAPPRDVFNSATFTDWVFRIPAIELAELGIASGSSVWMYEFAERSDSFDGLLGACHAIDVPFVWDNISARGVRMLLGERTDARRELASLIADHWVRFAMTGDPNPAGRRNGPDMTWHPGHPPVAADSVVTVEDPNGDERQLWPVRSPEPR